MDAKRGKRKVAIKILEVFEPQRHMQFEIKLPSNVKRITGVIITTSQIGD